MRVRRVARRHRPEMQIAPNRTRSRRRSNVASVGVSPPSKSARAYGEKSTKPLKKKKRSTPMNPASGIALRFIVNGPRCASARNHVISQRWNHTTSAIAIPRKPSSGARCSSPPRTPLLTPRVATDSSPKSRRRRRSRRHHPKRNSPRAPQRLRANRARASPRVRARE